MAVRKLYPDRLSITLLEHKPVAIWNDTNFVSEQGTVFSLPKDRIDKMDFHYSMVQIRKEKVY